MYCRCFLVTYYFTQHILWKYLSASEPDMEQINEEVAVFVRRFGTYLQIHSCLAFSARVKADRAVDELLAVSRFDPSHRDAVKEIQNAKDLTFYDAVSRFSCRRLSYPLAMRRNNSQLLYKILFSEQAFCFIGISE